jgi:hypothetical protein
MNKCKSKTYHLLFALVVLILSNACIPYKNIDFQILKPAQVKLGSYKKDVVILCKYCNDTTSFLFMDSMQRLKARTSLNFLYTLRENLEKSPLFEDSQFSFRAENPQNGDSKKSLIIKVDSIYLKDTIIAQRMKYASYSMYTFGVIHRFGCTVFTTDSSAIISNYMLHDTVFWPPVYTDDQVEAEWSEIQEAFWDTGIKAGKRYAHYLAPYWIDQSRIFYYRYSPVFKRAYEEIQKDKLDSALTILRNFKVKNSHQKQRARTLHNMAVVYELSGEIENALSMADSSNTVKKNRITKEFSDKLKIRKIDQIALDWQLSD